MKLKKLLPLIEDSKHIRLLVPSLVEDEEFEVYTEKDIWNDFGELGSEYDNWGARAFGDLCVQSVKAARKDIIEIVVG